ncbi:hypothetical protein [Polaromonas glacialis]|uniref:hypothetical protein n=1 Tax=Polaromonas glacialis TaxID=866564 RepID=UPI00049740D3|nr:hypothetical protein [Polaromonas glacialis]
MNKTVLAASLALALTVSVVGKAAHAQQSVTSAVGQGMSSVNVSTVSATLVPQPPTLVNTTTADYQDLKTSSALADGGYLLVWDTTTMNPARDGSRFYLQRFDSEGNRVGGETRLQLTVQDGSIAVLTNGDIVVAYKGARDAQGKVITSPNASSGAFIQKFNASGIQIMPETAVATTFGTSTTYGFVTVVPLTDGGFVVSWTSRDESSGTVRNSFSAQSYNSSGQRSGSPVVLSADSFPPSRPIDYSIQASPDGGYLVYKRMIDTANSSGCFGAMSEPTITSVSYYDKNLVPKQILAPTHCGILMPLKGDQYMMFGANATGPYSQLIDGNGSLVGPQKPIAARSEFRNPEFTIFTGRTVLVDGSYLLFWYSGASGNKGQRYTSKGDPIGDVFTIAATPKNILPLTGGSVTVAWSASNEIANNLLDVYMQRLNKPEAAGCAESAAWVLGQQYVAGARVTYTDGLTYVAKFANPGYNPTISTFFWAPVACCTKPAAWVRGQQYAAGALVSYSNGLPYVAKLANPGYDPTISTFFWAPVACTKPAAWVSGQQYAAGALATYSNGLTYVAKFDNPGYDPTISTYFWAPVGY